MQKGDFLVDPLEPNYDTLQKVSCLWTDVNWTLVTLNTIFCNHTVLQQKFPISVGNFKYATRL